MSKPTISEDAFRKALADQFRHAPDNAMTSKEIAAKMGLPQNTAKSKIDAMLAAGILEYAGKSPRPKVTGEMLRVATYRLTGKAGRK